MHILLRLRKNFRSKIIAPIAMLLIILSITQIVYLSTQFSRYSDHLIKQKITAHSNNLNAFLQKSQKQSRVAAISLAQNVAIIDAIKKRDRRRLIEIFAAYHDFYEMNFCTITDSKGIVIARTHEPHLFGDSGLHQQSIRDALDGKVSTYFEEGRIVKVSARTGAPVYDSADTLIGVVSIGVRFDTNSAVDRLKALSSAEATVFLHDERVATTIMHDGQRITGTKMNPEVAQAVLKERREYFDDITLFGIRYKTYYKPLTNPEGEGFGAFFVGIPMKEFKAASAAFIRDGVVISMIGLAVSIALLYFIIATISRPITRLARQMEQVAEGDLGVSIVPRGEDELSLLSKSLLKVVDIIHKLLADINHMIDEQKKGVTDYRFDSSEFRGDYRILADNILELAIVGTKDQLTGLPNRRTFDSRMELEWHRAMREETHLSVLMIDVDRFKNYNDTYGHPQGDLALQTIAGVFSRFAGRPADIAARWGGEEFVVLLPQTDVEGALQVAERIRAGVEDVVIPVLAQESARRVTVSIGMETRIPTADDSIHDFIHKADDALYKAKAQGRNRVVYEG